MNLFAAQQPARRSQSARAFTLIELLVAIGVSGVLIGLLLPAIAGARRTARRTATLIDLRQIGVSLSLYAGDAGEAFPYHEPGEPYLVGPPDAPSGLLFDSNDPWSMAYTWPALMHRVAPWTEHYHSWVGGIVGDGAQPWLDANGRWRPPAYRLSNTLTASPGTWAPAGDARIRAVRMHELRFPSGKVTAFDAVRAYLRPNDQTKQRAGLRGDQSAAVADDGAAATPAINRLRGAIPAVYHDTPDGVAGRDF